MRLRAWGLVVYTWRAGGNAGALRRRIREDADGLLPVPTSIHAFEHDARVRSHGPEVRGGGDMSVHPHTLVRRGDYRLVAFARTPDSPPDPDDITGYAVTTALGVVLHRELGFDEARALLDHLVVQPAQERGPCFRVSRGR